MNQLRTVAISATIFLLSLVSTLASTMASAQEVPSWRDFKNRHISADGRVIDGANGGISHSEGQGAGMLLAVLHDDRATFQSIWSWSEAHLQIRDDQLLVWKWDPRQNPNVTDRNNASDGDILTAWALYLGFQRWGDPAHRKSADAIASDIRQKLLRQSAWGVVLLPGVDGFESSDGMIINLSYWVFPAFATFDRYSSSNTWNELRDSGLKLLRQARFGSWQLPPDWLRISANQLAVAAKPFNPRFGYDAVRIPLYLIWAGADTPELLQPYLRFWVVQSQSRSLPAWVDLGNGTTSPYAAPQGFQAIVALTKGRAGFRESGAGGNNGTAEDYYSTLLGMLAAMAREGPGGITARSRAAALP